MTTERTPELRDDLIVGADALASYLGMTQRQVYGAVERRTLPFFKIGAHVCARKSVLLAWIERQESAFVRAGGQDA